MKILFEISNLDIAGAQKMMLDLACYLKKKGHDIVVLVLSDNPENFLSDMLRANEVKTYYAKYNRKSIKRFWRKFFILRNTIRQEKPDVIHGNLDYRYLWFFSLISKKKFVCTFHSQPYRIDSMLSKFLYRLLINRNLIIPVFLNEGQVCEFANIFKTDASGIKVIPNAIDLSTYSFSKRSEDERIVKFGIAARFHPIKNHEMLVRAFKLVLEKNSYCELILAGEGEEKERIKSICNHLGIDGKVTFLGNMSDIWVFLKMIDIGVLCSDSEAFPLFVLECMAAGIPMILTEVGEMREIAQNNALYVEKGNYKQLAEAMEKMLSDRQLRYEMGTRGTELVKKYDLSVVAKEYEELYEKVLTL